MIDGKKCFGYIVDFVNKMFLRKIFGPLPNRNLQVMMFIKVFYSRSIPPDESISFDNTFKVASNIGYLREGGKWICEYDGLFILLNKDGKIVSWQLTKGTSFAHINDLLQQIIKHHQDQCIKINV